MVAPFFPSVHYATSSLWYPNFHNLISFHLVYVWSPVGYTNSLPFFALLTSWPIVCKRSVFPQFCDQTQSSMHQIHPNAFSSFYRTVTHVHDFSRPQLRLFAPHDTTHPPTIKALQTTEWTKLTISMHCSPPGNDLLSPRWTPIALATTLPIQKRWNYFKTFYTKY